MKKLLFTLATLACMFVAKNAQAQDEKVLASILKMVSPVEVSELIRTQGIAYNASILHKADKAPKYLTDLKQALNLGIYSTDLGYATINKQNKDALTYMTTVKGIAEALKVGQFINTGRIMQLAMNKNDLNKLLDETATTFENISDHLEGQKKSNLAALMLTGGWLEMLSITCEVANTKPSPELSERIISQKLILDQLLDVLKPHATDKYTKNLFAQMGGLKTIFDAYKLEANNGTSTTKVVKDPITGVETLETTTDGNTKDVNLSADDIKKILGKVKEIRKEITE